MTTWTPEREADIRAIAERMEGEAGHLLRATLAALDDERARREAAERERDDIAELLAPSVSAWDAAGMQGRDGPMLVAERDEARAALAALREAVARTNETMESLRIDDLDANEAARTLRWVRELRAALSAAAPIAGRYRASVLREAKRICDDRGAAAQDAGDLVGWQACTGCGHAIEALADAAEKGEGW